MSKHLKKCAIYGGTFNPPHVGHIKAAEAFFDTVMPDELLIIPTYVPPHKSAVTDCSPENRMKMCEIAFSHIPKTVISDMEIIRGGKSYTYMTLEALASNEKKLFLLCGTDMFITLDSWKMPEVIFELATICLIRRESNKKINRYIEEKYKLYKNKYGAQIIEIQSDITELSSTEIREALYNDKPLDNMLTPEVADYIRQKGLYR